MKLSLAALFLIANATLADDAANEKLLKELQGPYKLVAVERSGGAPEGFVESIERITINGNKLILSFKEGSGKKEEKSATIILDASQKPQQIDLQMEGADDRGRGILLLEGDTLKFCWNDGKKGGMRPNEFKTSKDDKNMLMTLKRIK